MLSMEVSGQVPTQFRPQAHQYIYVYFIHGSIRPGFNSIPTSSPAIHLCILHLWKYPARFQLNSDYKPSNTSMYTSSMEVSGQVPTQFRLQAQQYIYIYFIFEGIRPGSNLTPTTSPAIHLCILYLWKYPARFQLNSDYKPTNTVQLNIHWKDAVEATEVLSSYSVIQSVFAEMSSWVWTLGCPKKKFCESWQVMGEVIIKWFYFYYFLFRQLFERAMLKNQNQFFFSGAQSTRNAAENYKKKIADFRKFYYFIIIFLWIYIIFHILIQPNFFF